MKASAEDRILAFIADYTGRRGVSPTIREIADGIGYASTGSVHRHIANLKAEGLLGETGGKSRSLVVNSGVSARPGDETEHHLCLKTSDGGSLFLSFVMREDGPEFSGPFCTRGVRDKGEIVACCPMTEEAYDSAMERYWEA